MDEIPQNDGTKECPFCAETIKLAAVVCRYCRSNLTPGDGATAEDGKKPQGLGTRLESWGTSTMGARQGRSGSTIADGVKLGCGMFVVLPVLMVLGLFLLLFGSC